MNILITNDDGYSAKGIHVLAEIMCQFGNVTVIAPKTHQSGMSMAVSLGLKQIAYKELPDEKPGKWSYLDATPASCVKFGLNVPFLDHFPDVVVSGINHGSNAASAACYSGTLGAAEEAAELFALFAYRHGTLPQHFRSQLVLAVNGRVPVPELSYPSAQSLMAHADSLDFLCRDIREVYIIIYAAFCRVIGDEFPENVRKILDNR